MRIITAIMAAVLLTGCSVRKAAEPPSAQTPPVATSKRPGLMTGGSQAVPRAQVYRMSGEWQDYVPVQVDAAGQLTSYPAPTDISDAARPVYMGSGLWLDRRGVSVNSVFTRYTYREYSALDSTPSPRELLESIIPDARVTKVYALPFPIWDSRDSAKVKDYILEHPEQFNP